MLCLCSLEQGAQTIAGITTVLGKNTDSHTGLCNPKFQE
jgi:hypothetical protein